MLAAHRAVANWGLIQKVDARKKMIEADVSKAYRSEFSKQHKHTSFNDFDIFQPYDSQQVFELSLSIVKEVV